MMLGRGGVDLPDESDEEDDDFVPVEVIDLLNSARSHFSTFLPCKGLYLKCE
jgi:hypothetical protein